MQFLGHRASTKSIDEQTGQAGMQTRLEALIDLAWSRKKKRQATSERFLSSVQQA